MHTANRELLAGALDNLIRYALTGCGQAAHRASDLLDRLSASGDMDGDMRRLYDRMSEALDQETVGPIADSERRPVSAGRIAHATVRRPWLTWERIGMGVSD